MSGWIWVALAAVGAFGAVARYLLDGFVSARREGSFPFGTLAVNLTGSFVLGIVTGLVLYHAFPGTPKLLIGTGFCGSYTTFSTLSLESVSLARDGERLSAALNVVGSVVAGSLAAALGLALAAL